MSFSAAKAFAEAPAKTGDFAAARVRWSSLLDQQSHPAAAVYVARYATLTGDVAAALSLIESAVLAEEAPVSLLPEAVRKLYLVELGAAWVRTLAKARANNSLNPIESQEAMSRLARAEFLMVLPSDSHATARSLLADIAVGVVAPPDVGPALAFLGAYEASEAAAFVARHRPSAAAFEHAARLVAAKINERRLDAGARQAFLTTYRHVPSVVGLFVAKAANVESLCEVLAGASLANWSDRDVGRLANTAVRLGLAWFARQYVRRLHLNGGSVSGEIRQMPYLALAEQDTPLALAYALGAAATGVNQRTASDAAQTLMAIGHRKLAAAALNRARETDEAAAFVHASCLWKGGPEVRVDVWEPALKLFGTARLRRGQAAALAEDCCYADAIAMLEASLREDPVDAAWRDVFAILSRICDYDGWERMLSELETQKPGVDWVVAERLRYQLATSGAAALDTEATVTSTYQARVTAQHLPAIGESIRAFEIWSRICANSDNADDHYHHVAASLQIGDMERATSLLGGIMLRFPGDYRFHLKRAQLMERQGNYLLARESFARSLDVEPWNVDGLAGVARCLTYLEEFSLCETWLDLVPQRSVLDSWCHAARAFNSARAGRHQAAADHLTRQRALIGHALGEIERIQRENPAAVWYNGRVLKGHSERAARNADRFRADLEWLLAETPVLVGNSPALLGSGLGKRIDAHGRVIRLNDFKLDGHETDVGSRCSLWFSSANLLASPNVKDLNDTRVWLAQPNPQHLPDPGIFTKSRLGMRLPEAVFLPSYLHQLSSRVIYPRPTTGLRWIGLLDLILQCPYKIAGFSFFQEEILHYFAEAENGLQVGEVHAIAFERDFVTEILRPMCISLP